MSTVAILDLPRHYALDVALPAHVFGRHPRYEVIDAVADADLVVVPGYEQPELEVDVQHVEAVRAAHDRGARVLALCTGVFALAAGGLLDGRRATTHWRSIDLLRSMHPAIDVVENRLLVEDGRILTSAGASASIDACLHVIESDLGAAAAADAAREAVSPRRHAGESQHAELPAATRRSLSRTRDWVLADLAAPVSVQSMADHALLSRRSFIRHFERETGMPPMRWVAWQRVLAARRLLEESDWPVERIATETGFGTATSLRNSFRRETGTTPGAYRAMHEPAAAAEGAAR